LGSACETEGVGVVDFSLPPDPLAAGEARRRVRTLSDLPEEVVISAELVVSELITNSVLHAELGPDDVIEVSLRRDDDRLVIEVDDHDGLSGRAGAHPVASRPGGLGLKMLDTLCEHWHAESGRVVASLSL
jgi:two-component sensor histidine kinase